MASLFAIYATIPQSLLICVHYPFFIPYREYGE